MWNCSEQSTKNKQTLKKELSLAKKNILSIDSLFQLKKDSLNFKAENSNYSLTIGNLFLNKNKYAIFRVRETDTVSLVYILKQNQLKWDTIFKQRIFPIDLEILEDYEQRVDLEDFNGDDIPDLKILTNCYHSPMLWYHDMWIFKNDNFTKINGFNDVVNSSYDKETNSIYSYESEGCADMSMFFVIYKIKGNQVVKQQEVHCDCCEEDTCRIQIIGKKEILVSRKKAHLHVPKFYVEMVKYKCSL